MPPEKPAAIRRSYRAAGGLVVLGLVLAGLLVVAREPTSPRPSPALASAAQWADESSCLNCHEQAEEFWRTGHARTLQRATTPHSRELLAKVATAAGPRAENTAIRERDGRLIAVTENDGRETAVELDWCFGSGDHASTWASTVADSSGATDELEFRWSVYHGDVVAITPGQPEEPLPGRFGKLGVWFDSPKAYRCFSCHASVLPTSEGAIREEHIQAGVTCQRCHGPRLEHVLSDGQAGHARWPTHDRMESVNRCAECHRRADELAPDEISTHNRALIRFQPAGLVQSPCFIKSDMDCMTCHDPHLPLEAQNSRGIWQCVQCHSPEDDSHVLCGLGKSDECLECHMPALPMDAPVSFTDHWIRVREPVAE